MTNGPKPMFLYNGYDLTEHMSYFGVVEGRIVFGVSTAQGWGREREIQAIQRMLLG